MEKGPDQPPGLASRLAAPAFIPSSGAASVLAKPFVPSTSSQTQQQTSRRTGSSPSAEAAAFVPSSKAFAPAAAAPLGGAAPPGLVKSSAAAGTLNDVQSTADAATFSLPEDDDLLGMSSSAPGQGMSAKDLASQAADIFRAMRPMAGPPPHGGGPGPPAALSTGLAPPLPPMHGASGGGRGRGAAGLPAPMPGQGQRFPQMAPGLGPASRFPPQQGPGSGPFFPGAPSGGRGPAPGRGRGRGRGRGGPPPGPGANRPFVAAYALTPGRMQLAGRFLPETLHQEMQQRTFLATAQLDDEALAAAELPHTLHQYHSICPLEDRALAAEHPSAAFGVGTLILKATHSGDGAAYAVRRIDGRQAVPTADLLASAEATVERWALVANHPNVIGLREAFVSDEIDATSSLYFSYDFHPGAYTLEQAHILPTHTPQGLSRTAASEEQLWSYLVQLTSALRAIHSAGLVVGSAALSPSKVLLVAPTRVRLGALGIAEALAEGAPADTPQAQRDDLAALGSLLLVLACSARNAPPTLDVLAAHYSRELVHVVAGLLAAGEGAGFASWRSLVAALGDRIFSELEAANTATDTLAGELQKECENGRLARLLIKLAMVNERPELFGDTRWAETGDRYLLKLFRDFVFHQVTESGAPMAEWGHVIEALNKADAGVEEKIILLSRDEASMLVVSYGDVRRCLQAAYEEIRVAAGQSSGGGGGMRGGGGRGTVTSTR